MGMRVNTGSGIDPHMVEKLVELERQPIKNLEVRKTKISEDQKLFRELVGHIKTLGTSVTGLKTRNDFYKLKLESSDPDIIDGTVTSQAMIGSYQLEVKNLARTQKHLAAAFPDADKTPVGFGYMSIEKEDGTSFDVDIDPNACTLNDVVKQINSSGAGVKAIVLNTRENIENPGTEGFRLLVINEKSGKEAKVTIDPDSTYLEFEENVPGSNLEVQFEDVSVFSDTNSVDTIMPGLVLNAKRAQPGKKVSIKIDYDVDKTVEGIKGFVDSYNKINEFLENQFKVDPGTQKAGQLSNDNTLRSIRFSLQTALQHQMAKGTGEFRNLNDVGISTTPSSGALKLDETRLKEALSKNYEKVAELFIETDDNPGVIGVLSQSIKALQNPASGSIPSRERQMSRALQSMDDQIASKERLAVQRADTIKRRFSALETLVNSMNAQGQSLARFNPGS